MGGDLKLVDLAASNTDTLVDSDVTVYPIHIDQGWTMLLYVWAAYRKTQVTKSRNIQI